MFLIIQREQTKTILNIKNGIVLLIVFCNIYINISFLINQPQLSIDYRAGSLILIMLIELIIHSNNASLSLQFNNNFRSK